MRSLCESMSVDTLFYTFTDYLSGKLYFDYSFTLLI